MNRPYEIEVSALLDDELAHREVLEVVDRLMESPQLRVFYRQARSLDLVLEEGGVSDAGGRMPGSLWEKIEDRARGVEVAEVDRRRHRSRRLPGWALAVAAAVIVAVGLGAVGWQLQSTGRGDEGVVNVRLEGDPDSMTDDRFVELTAELLRADRRYQRTMGEILAAVNEERRPVEGSIEGREPLDDRGLRRVSFDGLETDDQRPRVWD